MQMSTGWGTGSGTKSSEFHAERLVLETVTDLPIQDETPSDKLEKNNSIEIDMV